MTTWADDAVFYHVYPLGLCGAPARNSRSDPPVPRLEAMHPWIGHIAALGANALYLGPVFESTAHGYDTADYYHVDRRLGTTETLRELVDRAHAAGIRVVLDGVFHHVGRDFWAFRDVLARGPESAFRDWFHDLRFDGRSPYGDPFTYAGWHGHYDLVKLNLANPAVRDHLFGAVEAWMLDLDIDGLRLDAADCIDAAFLHDLAAFCRERRPEFWLMGEVVHGDYRRWVGPGMLDSVTNYECYKGLYSSLNDRNYFEIAYALRRQFEGRGIYAGLPLYAFADNHDVDRVASVLRNRGHLYPLYALLLTMPGVPSVYYGSEWGLEGARGDGDDAPLRPRLDLSSVAGDGSAPELAAAIARLTRIRAASPALRRGSYRQLHVAHEQLAFARETDDERVVVLLNAAAEAATLDVPAPRVGTWGDLLNPGWRCASDGRLRADVPPCWARILVAEE